MARVPKFEKVLINSRAPVAASMLLILSWIAISDDCLDQNEFNHLFKIAQQSSFQGDIKLITNLAKNQDLGALSLALEILRQEFSKEIDRKRLFMDIVIRMSLADGLLCPEELNILQLLSDALGYTSQSLNKHFKEITGKYVPENPDLSKTSTWEKFDRQKSNNKTESRTSSSIVNALRTLGLQKGTNIEDIKKRFRKLAHETHPDKFQHLGKAAQVVARENFQTIKSSYDYLVKIYEKPL